MQARIFRFGLKNMGWKGKTLAYITVVFNFLLFFSYLAYLSDPLRSTWISFTGLFYPIILIFNIFLLIVWILKRKLFFLPTLIIIILGMYHHSRFFQFYAIDNTDDNINKLKVMSYNVRLFDLYNWNKNKESKAQIMSLINDVNPDVLCIQEYYFTEDKKLAFNTRNYIIDSLEFKYYYESFSEESKNENYFGMATFSKYPILNSGSRQFSNDISNQFIYTDIKKENDTIRIYNSHIGSIRFNHTDYKVMGGKGNPIWPHQKPPKRNILSKLKKGFKKRSTQVKSLTKHINASTLKTIVCMDMNDTPISYSYHQMDKYLNDAFTNSGFGFGGTYIGNIPALRIDYIWHDKKLGSSNFVVHDENLSDHKAISAEIILP